MTFAQSASSDLSQDPVFSTVLNRRLRYPRQAEWSSVYGRVFAEFTIDDKGHVQDISILNHSEKGTYYGLEPTIITALKKLPSLNLRYTGSYILPVSFIYVDYRQKDKPFVPKDTLYIQDLAGRIALKEIKIMGNSTNSRERILSAGKNEYY
ncbi:energy transducer TonB [Spirosoma pollinicola]|nr:energy transducer TonB [Spirosoma pollinicola]